MAPPVYDKGKYLNKGKVLSFLPGRYLRNTHLAEMNNSDNIFLSFMQESAPEKLTQAEKDISDVRSKMGYHGDRGSEGAMFLAFVLGQQDSKGKPLFTYEEVIDPTVRLEDKKEIYRRFISVNNNPDMVERIDEACLRGTLEIRKAIETEVGEAVKHPETAFTMLHSNSFNTLLAASMAINETWSLPDCQNTRDRISEMTFKRPGLVGVYNDVLNNIQKDSNVSGVSYLETQTSCIQSLQGRLKNFYSVTGLDIMNHGLDSACLISNIMAVYSQKNTLSDTWMDLVEAFDNSMPDDLLGLMEVLPEDEWSKDIVEERNLSAQNTKKLFDNMEPQPSKEQRAKWIKNVRSNMKPLLKLCNDATTDPLLKAGLLSTISSGTFFKDCNIPTIHNYEISKRVISDYDALHFKVPSKAEIYRSLLLNDIEIPAMEPAGLAGIGIKVEPSGNKVTTISPLQTCLNDLKLVYPDENSSDRYRMETLLNGMTDAVLKRPDSLTNLAEVRRIKQHFDRNIPDLLKTLDKRQEEINKLPEGDEKNNLQEQYNKFRHELTVNVRDRLDNLLSVMEAGLTPLPERTQPYDSKTVIDERAELLKMLSEDFAKNKVTFPSVEWQMMEKSLARAQAAHAAFENAEKKPTAADMIALSDAMADLQRAADKYLEYKAKQPESDFSKSYSRVFLANRVKRITQREVFELAPLTKEKRQEIERDPFSHDNLNIQAKTLDTLLQEFNAKGVQGSSTKTYDTMFRQLQDLQKMVSKPNAYQANELLQAMKKAKESVDAYLTHKERSNNHSFRSERRITLANEAKAFLDSMLPVVQLRSDAKHMTNVLITGSDTYPGRLIGRNVESALIKMSELTKDEPPHTIDEHKERFERYCDTMVPVLLTTYLEKNKSKLANEVLAEMVKIGYNGNPTECAKQLYEKCRDKLPGIDSLIHHAVENPAFVGEMMRMSPTDLETLSASFESKEKALEQDKEYEAKYGLRLSDNAEKLVYKVFPENEKEFKDFEKAVKESQKKVVEPSEEVVEEVKQPEAQPTVNIEKPVTQPVVEQVKQPEVKVEPQNELPKNGQIEPLQEETQPVKVPEKPKKVRENAIVDLNVDKKTTFRSILHEKDKEPDLMLNTRREGLRVMEKTASREKQPIPGTKDYENCLSQYAKALAAIQLSVEFTYKKNNIYGGRQCPDEYYFYKNDAWGKTYLQKLTESEEVRSYAKKLLDNPEATLEFLDKEKEFAEKDVDHAITNRVDTNDPEFPTLVSSKFSLDLMKRCKDMHLSPEVTREVKNSLEFLEYVSHINTPTGSGYINVKERVGDALSTIALMNAFSKGHIKKEGEKVVYTEQPSPEEIQFSSGDEEAYGTYISGMTKNNKQLSDFAAKLTENPKLCEELLKKSPDAFMSELSLHLNPENPMLLRLDPEMSNISQQAQDKAKQEEEIRAKKKEKLEEAVKPKEDVKPEAEVKNPEPQPTAKVEQPVAQPTVEVKRPEEVKIEEAKQPEPVVEEVKPKEEAKQPEITLDITVPEKLKPLLNEIEQDCKANNYPEVLFPGVKDSIGRVCGIQANKELNEQQKREMCKDAMKPLLTYMYLKTYPYKVTSELIVGELAKAEKASEAENAVKNEEPSNEKIVTQALSRVMYNSASLSPFISKEQEKSKENPQYFDELLGGNLTQMLDKVADKTARLTDSLDSFTLDNELRAHEEDSLNNFKDNLLEITDRSATTKLKSEVQDIINRYTGIALMRFDRIRSGNNTPGDLEKAYLVCLKKYDLDTFWNKFSKSPYARRTKEITDSIVSAKEPKAAVEKFLSQYPDDFAKTITSGKLYFEMSSKLPENTFKKLEGHLTNLEDNKSQNNPNIKECVTGCAMVCSYLALRGLAQRSSAIKQAIKGHAREILQNISKDEGFRKSIIEISKEPKKLQKLLGQSMEEASKMIINGLKSKELSSFLPKEPAPSLSGKNENSVGNKEAKSEEKEDVKKELTEDIEFAL